MTLYTMSFLRDIYIYITITKTFNDYSQHTLLQLLGYFSMYFVIILLKIIYCYLFSLTILYHYFLYIFGTLYVTTFHIYFTVHYKTILCFILLYLWVYSFIFKHTIKTCYCYLNIVYFDCL